MRLLRQGREEKPGTSRSPLERHPHGPEHVLEPLREEVLVVDADRSPRPGVADLLHQGHDAPPQELERPERARVREELRHQPLSVERANEGKQQPERRRRRPRASGALPRGDEEGLEVGLGQTHDVSRPVAARDRLRDPAKPPHVALGVQPMSRRLAPRHGKAVALLPDAQRVGRETGRARDGSDRPPRRDSFRRIHVTSSVLPGELMSKYISRHGRRMRHRKSSRTQKHIRCRCRKNPETPVPARSCATSQLLRPEVVACVPSNLPRMSEAHFIGGDAAPDDRLQDHALYFNREISWLAFNRRVLEEAHGSGLASPRAHEVPRDLPLEPRRVLHDPRLGPARADRGVGRRAQRRRALGARAAPDGPRDRAARHRPRHAHAPRRPPAEARGGGRRHPGLGGDRAGAAQGARGLLRERRVPGPHAARLRSGAPVPVRLEPLALARGRAPEKKDEDAPPSRA